MTHLRNQHVLSEAQHGFQECCSCETPTAHNITSSLDNRKQTDAIISDFMKAFDKVPHSRLCMRLDYYGIRNYTLHWIKDFLSGRTQQVVLDGYYSNTLPVTSGVPQGSVLGPLLLLYYINDLPERVYSYCCLYADDILLYQNIESRKMIVLVYKQI